VRCVETGANHGVAEVAANPLNDRPLRSSHPSEHIFRSDTCRVWPQLGPDALALDVADSLVLEATDAQLCVIVEKMLPEKFAGREPTEHYETVKVGTDNAPRGIVIGAEKTGATKVGMCETSAVWKVRFKGCEPNTGIVNRNTKTLFAGEASWEFPTAAVAPGTPPPKESTK
jgi:hypothetical protein